MTQITAAMVKQLRDMVGAGMKDCKTALTESDGDMDAAVDWLRAKGLAQAAKKAARTAVEGLIGVAGASQDGPAASRSGALVEVNSETDFVARNKDFQDMAAAIAGVALQVGGDIAALKAAAYPGLDRSVDEHIKAMVGVIGENLTLRRAEALQVKDGVVASYVHGQMAPGLGRIGVLVALESTAGKEKLAALGKQIAMHVAAANPLAVQPQDIAPDIVERERTVFAEQARTSGKPQAIIDKMVEGRMGKFYKESVLLSQIFVIDGENTVAQAIANAEKDLGASITVTGFRRMQLGEGIAVEPKDDFAAEVAKALS